MEWNSGVKYYLSPKLKKDAAMTKFSAILLAAGFCFPVLLRAQHETIDTAMIKRIREEGLTRSQVATIAHQVTDVAGPRLTNSPGFHRAADWIIKTLQGWGLSGAKEEAWGQFGYGWSAEKTVLAMRTPYYSPMIAYAVPWSGSTNGPVTASVFILNRMDSAWVADHLSQMKGKIILVMPQDTINHPRYTADAERLSDSALANLTDTYIFTRAMLNMYVPYFVKQLKVARMIQSSGALAAIGSDGGRDGTVFVQTFIGYRKQDQPAIPQLQVAKEDLQRVMRIAEEGGEVTLELQSDTRLYDQDLQGHNVVAEIPGTDPTLKSEIVMLGGHLDSWSAATGATDNGAGSIVAIEAVRILTALGVKPKRTIRIALWDGEEEGLLGSFGYVKNHFGDPADMKFKPEQSKVSVYFNLDNGTGKIRGIYAEGNEKVVPIFQQWFAPFKDLGASTVTLHKTGSTDHVSFDAIGIPGFQFVQDPIDYETRTHHSNEDNYDHLVMSDLMQAATIEAAFVYLAAMRPEMMPRKPLPKPEKFLFDDFLP
jgi:carboxypeptidase Q